MNRSLLLTVAAWLSLLSLSLNNATAEAREWSDASGKFRTEAEFVGTREGPTGTLALLKKPNGVTVGVPVAKLSPADQAFIKAQASTDTPDGAMKAIVAGVEKGKLRVIWDALPSSYQQDIHEVLHSFGESMDPELWKAGFTVTGKLVNVLRTKREFILKQPLLAVAMQNAPDPKVITDNWDDILLPFDTLVKSDLSKLDKLKTLNVGTFLDTTGAKLAEQMIALSKKVAPPGTLPTGGNAKVTLLEHNGDTGLVRVEEGDKVEEVALVRVEGKWLPKEMVDGWQDGIAKAKEAIAGLKAPDMQQNKAQFLLSAQMVGGALDQMQNADTQESFDKVIAQVMQVLGPALQGAGGGAAPPAAPGKRPTPTDDPFGQ